MDEQEELEKMQDAAGPRGRVGPPPEEPATGGAEPAPSGTLETKIIRKKKEARKR